MEDGRKICQYSGMPTIEELVKRNRSYRRFHEHEKVGPGLLKRLVDLTRDCASAANLQPLKYIISSEPEKNNIIYPHLNWAGYLAGWPGPDEGERPPAYIIILGDLKISRDFSCNHGIAAQTILLGAVEAGLGGCIISSIDRPGLSGALAIPDGYEVLLVVAIGRPREVVVITGITPGGDIKYWRDARGVHYVPKRSLEEILLNI